MAGIDTLRGVGFQHASAVSALVDLIEDVKGGELRIEGAEDIVDYEVRDASGKRQRIVQARTRSEPGVFGPADLWPILARWSKLDDVMNIDAFEFHTDSQLGPSAVKDIANPLERFRLGTTTPDDVQSVEQHGIPANSPVLQRVQLSTRSGRSEGVLAEAGSRLQRLLELRSSVSVEDVVNAVNRLYVRCAVADGGPPRTITRSEAAGLVGVDLNEVDTRDTWTEAVLQQFHTAAAANLAPVAGLPAPAQPFPPAARPIGSDDFNPRQFGDLVRDNSRLALIGVTGAGKTMALALTEASTDLVAIRLRADSYRAGTLARKVRLRLEELSGARLSPRGVEDLLHSPRLVLLLDGVAEANPEAQKALFDDVSDLAEDNTSLRVVVTGRTDGTFRPWTAPVYILVAPSQSRRIEIAELIFPGQGATVEHEIGRRIGQLVGNPLLYSLALAAFARGSTPAVPVQLYREFLAVLSDRSHGDLTTTVRIAVAEAARSLLLSGRRSAFALEWIGLLAECVSQLAERGAIGGTVTADQVLKSARRAGLLVGGDWDEIVFLHDSFADYLVAEAYVEQKHPFPAELSENLYDVIRFMAQLTDLPDDVLILASQDPILASRIAQWETTNFTADHMVRFVSCLGAMFNGDAPSLILSRDQGWVSAAIAEPPTRWVSAAEFASQSIESDTVLSVPDPVGPLRLAVEVWSAVLAQDLGRMRSSVLVPIPDTKGDVIAALSRHFTEMKATLQTLAQRVAPRQAAQLIAATHASGFVASVGEAIQNPLTGRRDFNVIYNEGGDDILVDSEPWVNRGPQGSTVASFLLDGDPKLEARKRIIDTLAELSEGVLRL